MSERYKVVKGSESGHCCFKTTVVDTHTPDPLIPDEPVWVCECFDMESAQKIVDALNAASQPEPELTPWVQLDYRKMTRKEMTGYIGQQNFKVTALQKRIERLTAKVRNQQEALETALFGTPLDDVPNRDNDDIWHLCYPHLPERALDALRDHLARIETALAAFND